MQLRLVRLLLVLLAVAGATAACIVVPVPYRAHRVYAPPPPPVVYAPQPCAWVRVYGHWECR